MWELRQYLTNPNFVTESLLLHERENKGYEEAKAKYAVLQGNTRTTFDTCSERRDGVSPAFDTFPRRV